jgi:hypothetical protein
MKMNVFANKMFLMLLQLQFYQFCEAVDPALFDCPTNHNAAASLGKHERGYAIYCGAVVQQTRIQTRQREYNSMHCGLE